MTLPIQSAGVRRIAGIGPTASFRGIVATQNLSRGAIPPGVDPECYRNCFPGCRRECIESGTPAFICNNICRSQCTGECPEAEPVCGDCFPVISLKKTCEIPTGPDGESAIVTVDCGSPLDNCSPCFFALESRRRCCRGNVCENVPCPLPTPTIPTIPF